MVLCALTMFYPGFMDLFILMPCQLPEEHTARYCSLLGAVNLFVPHAFAVQPDCRLVKSVECGDTNGDLVITPMGFLYCPCKIDPTETRSPFNVPTPETVTSQVFTP